MSVYNKNSLKRTFPVPKQKVIKTDQSYILSFFYCNLNPNVKTLKLKINYLNKLAVFSKVNSFQ